MISMNWVKDYIDIEDENLDELADKVTKAGINVEHVISNHIDNLVVGKVLSCVPHPDSDHMHVCMVDVGKETIQIVCGAPNVKEGIKESVLTVNVRYKAYDVLEKKYLAALYLSVNSILGEEERALTLEELISMYEKMDKLLESKTTIIERTIKVYMNKEDGFWDTDNYNPELEATAMLCKYVIY